MFCFLSDLSESRLLPSKTSLKNWHPNKLAELAYLYFLGLHILLCADGAKEWARNYCKKAGDPNDFGEWRNAQNDLYAMLFALSMDNDEVDNETDIKQLDKIKISPPMIRHWLRHASVHSDATVREETHKLFMRLDTMFHITNASMKTMRRIIMNWDKADQKERSDTLTKLIQMIHDRAPSNSEILPHLKKLEGKEEKVEESSSTGSTGAANVATVVGGLGAGFDPDGDWRSIYHTKKKKSSSVIIKR